MSQRINADGRVLEVKPKNGKEWTLDELHAIVGGYIEFVRYGYAMGKNMLLVVNEDGIRLELPLNQNASVLAGQPILGDVLYCSTREVS